MPDTLREKVLRIIEDEVGSPAGYATDAILAIFAEERVKEQREAFVDGVFDGAAIFQFTPDRSKAEAEAVRRYPDA